MVRAILTATVLLAACRTATVQAPDATLRVVCADAARLYIDGKLVGGAAGPPVGLVAGTHRIEVRADGMLPAFREVTLRRGDRVELPVVLRPDLDREDPLANSP